MFSFDADCPCKHLSHVGAVVYILFGYSFGHFIAGVVCVMMQEVLQKDFTMADKEDRFVNFRIRNAKERPLYKS